MEAIDKSSVRTAGRRNERAITHRDAGKCLTGIVFVPHSVMFYQNTPGDCMSWDTIIWDDDPGGNCDKILQHGLTIDDVENALCVLLVMESVAAVAIRFCGDRRLMDA
jgi:hypothetical protein